MSTITEDGGRSPNDRVAPLDGIRALASLWLIALHAGVLATAHLPVAGPAADNYMRHPLWFAAAGAGMQVEIFLLVSGYLLGRQLRSAEDVRPLRACVRRACRLWPALGAAAVLQLLLGDVHADRRFSILARTLAFSSNYAPFRSTMTTGLATSWSVCADFHIGVALTLALGALRAACGPLRRSARGGRARRAFESRAVIALSALFVLSFGVRHALQDPERYAITALAWRGHMAYLSPPEAVPFMRVRYGLDLVPCSELPGGCEIGFRYMERLYLPTHARYGPMVLGALLAFALPSAAAERAAPRVDSRAALATRSAVQAIAVAAVLGACTRPPDAEPSRAARALATTAVHNVLALALAALVATVLSPAASPMHSAWLARALTPAHGRSPLSLLARASYAFNMLHTRVLSELAWGWLRPREGTHATWTYVALLWAVGTLLTAAIAIPFAVFIERPARTALEAAVAKLMRLAAVHQSSC